MIAALALALLAAVPGKPAFTGFVVDKAGVLDANAVEQITQTSTRLDKAGIAQIAVCTITEEMLGDASKEEYATDLFKAWGLGHGKKKADGLLLLLVPGKPGHRKIRLEVGYGLEGVLPDGKVGALEDQYAVPALRKDDYSGAATQMVQALAAVVEADAAAGGDAAAGKGTLRGGTGTGMGGPASEQPGLGGLVVAVLAGLALLISLLVHASRRSFPGKLTQGGALGGAVISVIALVVAGSGAGWIALVVALIVNAIAWSSIRSHKCPKDGSWMTIEEEILDSPTYWSEGLAHVTEQCTNRKCGYLREYDKTLPRKQRTTVVSGGGGGGGGGGGFSGGGGGDSGGGGAGRDV